MKTVKMRSKEEQAEIVKRALSMPTAEPKPEPICWSCGEPMAPITDPYGEQTHRCLNCVKSADDIHAVADFPRACVVEEIRVEGELKAVKICSFLLESHLWLLIDPDFFPPDPDPCFFSDEFSFLATKSVEELKEIIKVKCAFPRCRVRQ